jgi:hypothetical protein
MKQIEKFEKYKSKPKKIMNVYWIIGVCLVLLASSVVVGVFRHDILPDDVNDKIDDLFNLPDNDENNDENDEENDESGDENVDEENEVNKNEENIVDTDSDSDYVKPQPPYSPQPTPQPTPQPQPQPSIDIRPPFLRNQNSNTQPQPTPQPTPQPQPQPSIDIRPPFLQNSNSNQNLNQLRAAVYNDDNATALRLLRQSNDLPISAELLITAINHDSSRLFCNLVRYLRLHPNNITPSVKERINNITNEAQHQFSRDTIIDHVNSLRRMIQTNNYSVQHQIKGCDWD